MPPKLMRLKMNSLRKTFTGIRNNILIGRVGNKGIEPF